MPKTLFFHWFREQTNTEFFREAKFVPTPLKNAQNPRFR